MNLRAIFFSLLFVILLVSGCSEDVVTNSDLPGPVYGKVKDIYGNPLNSVRVSINRSAPVYLNASGDFYFDNVTKPYNLCMFSDDGTRFDEYKGLRISKLNLEMIATSSMDLYQKAIVILNHSKTQVGRILRIWFANNYRASTYPQYTSDSTIKLEISWKSENTKIDGRLMLLEVSDNFNMTKFEKFGYRDLELISYDSLNISLKSSDLSFNPTESAVHFKAGSGTKINEIFCYLNVSGYSRYSDLLVSGIGGQNISTSVRVPGTLPFHFGINYFVWASFPNTNMSVNYSGGTAPGWDVTLPNVNKLELLAPSQNFSSADSNTLFNVTSTGGTFILQFWDSTNSKIFRVITSDPSTVFPNIGISGLQFPRNSSYSWNVVNRNIGIDSYAYGTEFSEYGAISITNYSETGRFRTIP